MSKNRHEGLPVTGAHDLAAGDTIVRHRHDDHQIVYPSSGVVAVTTEVGSWIAPPDRALWIPAGAWHEHRFYGSARFHCVAFEPAQVRAPFATPAVVSVSPLVRELIVSCSLATDLPPGEGARLRQVLIDQLRHCPERPLHLPAPIDDRLRRACALVESDLSVARSLAELGRACGAGERTLSRLFRTEFGMTYPQWRTQLRLYRAVQLLAESMPVTAVATACGWSTPSAFIDVYRRVLGHTPGTRF
ncbi:AraC family transcriptional regulator [Nocardia stercoris]|uniref:HTH-type transcriptional regulator RipA n=1 Tax=Nocardia stercoris TaxID=2483361 RepID=A0A3M2LBF9_9NOCA|nr:helix-turn-helix transcriptional regulator [Nocardia stercoris]RMI33933.1 AraC family transcriptional regulator [Nocardia stercoris]